MAKEFPSQEKLLIKVSRFMVDHEKLLQESCSKKKRQCSGFCVTALEHVKLVSLLSKRGKARSELCV